MKMNRIPTLLGAIVFCLASASVVQAQSVNVTFRYLPSSPIFGVSLPGDFNGWNTGSSTAMTYVDSLDQWVRSQRFTAGTTTEYKFYVRPTSTSSGFWTNDPNNPLSNPSDNDNSILVVSDPLVFQLAEQENESGLVSHFSAGVFGSSSITSLTLQVAGSSPIDVLPNYDASSGILRIEMDSPLFPGTRFEVVATSAEGTATSSIGSYSTPIEWLSVDRKTTQATARLRAVVRNAAGQVDPSITSVGATNNGILLSDLTVVNGLVDQIVDLTEGSNVFVLQATIDGMVESSSELDIIRREGPIQDRLFDISISGSAFSFVVEVTDGSNSAGGATVEFETDLLLSTIALSDFSAGASQMSGTASGAGEVFVDIEYTDSNGSIDKARAAVVIAEDGSVGTYEWAEKASWIDQAVVYEIFPLTFGSVSKGVVGAESNRLNEIRQNLDYIKAMGFNTIWFMPIMQNVDLTGLGAGYNVIDFKKVDPKYGTNEDFASLVERAHELGIRIILDLTVNHSSPDHPWVESLRTDGDFEGYVQTTPNSHSRGLDGRGASLPEQWIESGLYRGYDGFGSLANLNWDNDDLQAEMLEIVQYWLTEYDIDGYRFDAYWGPWRKFGPYRFGVPIREVMRRYRPDAWALGELEGTGGGTEVYYADAENGTNVAGGLDSAYDWEFSGFVSGYGNYNRQVDYRSLISRDGFLPGPNARYFRFLENHDWSRIQALFSGNPDRVRPLTAMLMTVTGIPMIYQGQEVGYGAGSGDTRRLAVDWNQPENDIWAERHRLLATARATFPAFGTTELEFMSTPASTMAFVRPYQDQNAIVVINFSGGEKSFSIDPSDIALMSTDGPIPYFDLASDTVASHLGSFDVTLQGYSSAIFITEDDASLDLGPLPSLPYGAVYTAVEGDFGVVSELSLDQNYPNPASGETSITFSQTRSSRVQLEVFDILGRRVATLLNNTVPHGRHRVSFDSSSLNNGTYFYRLTSAQGQISRSMTILH